MTAPKTNVITLVWGRFQTVSPLMFLRILTQHQLRTNIKDFELTTSFMRRSFYVKKILFLEHQPLCRIGV